jgi:hypothetical protein
VSIGSRLALAGLHRFLHRCLDREDIDEDRRSNLHFQLVSAHMQTDIITSDGLENPIDAPEGGVEIGARPALVTIGPDQSGQGRAANRLVRVEHEKGEQLPGSA